MDKRSVSGNREPSSLRINSEIRGSTGGERFVQSLSGQDTWYPNMMQRTDEKIADRGGGGDKKIETNIPAPLMGHAHAPKPT
jgi:hypothetical protein